MNLSPEMAAWTVQTHQNVPLLMSDLMAQNDLAGLRTLLEALPNSRAAKNPDVKFGVLNWVGESASEEKKALVRDWIGTLSTPIEMAEEFSRRHQCDNTSWMAPAEALLEGMSSWLAENSAQARQARAQGLVYLLKNPRNLPEMDRAEALWLDRLMACQSAFPTLLTLSLDLTPERADAAKFSMVPSAFFPDAFDTGLYRKPRLQEVCDALARAFGPDAIRAKASEQLLNHLSVGSQICGLNSGWMEVALPRGWLTNTAKQALFTAPIRGSKSVHAQTSNSKALAKAICDQWDFPNSGAQRCLEAFIAQGLNLNATFRVGKAEVTALHCAVHVAQPDLVRRLLASGSDPHVKGFKLDDQGQRVGEGSDAFEMLEKFKGKVQNNEEGRRVAKRLDGVGELLQAAGAKRVVNDLLENLGVACNAMPVPGVGAP